MKKISFLLGLLVFTFTSCSDDHPTEGGGGLPWTTKPSLELTASAAKAEPFQPLTITVGTDPSLIHAHFDSLVWECDAHADNWISGPSDFEIKVCHYQSGIHTVFLSGYKEGTLIKKDSIRYETILPKGDFLSVKWNKTNEDQFFNFVTGATPVTHLPSQPDRNNKFGGVNFSLNHFVEREEKEYARLQFSPWRNKCFSFCKEIFPAFEPVDHPDVLTFDWHKERETLDPEYGDFEQSFYYDYLNGFYEPYLLAFPDDITDIPAALLQIYQERFTNQPSGNYVPVAIWITHTTNICLLREKLVQTTTPTGICQVIAEPK